MASLNIAKMVLDKESWENIPPMVFKSFQTTNTNMNAIKKWADFYEARAKSQTDFLGKMEEKLMSVEQSLANVQERMASGERNLAGESAAVRQQALTCARTFQRMEKCLAVVFSQIGQTFGLQIDCHQNPVVEGDLAHAVPEAEPESQNGVAMMETSVLGLERELETLNSAFERWRAGQAEDQERHVSLQTSIQELHQACQQSGEKISSCQETLEEHSRGNEALSASLAETQAAVQELHSTRVQHEDVEQAVQRKGEELELQQRTTDQQMERLGRRIEDHVSEVQKLVSDMGRQTEDKVEDYRSQVARMVEGHMNPLNAYLNTMHVKTDVIRVDLDKLRDQAPTLVSSIQEIMKKLEELQQAHETKASEWHESMDDMKINIAENVDRHDGQHEQLSKSMQDMSDALELRLKAITEFADKTSESLELVKREDLSGLARELLLLDQKVAKWVHSNPLPAKISEARLYSLEARLADEMDARIAFESKVQRGLQSPRRLTGQSEDLVLPQLQLSQESFGPGYAKNGPPSGRRRLSRDLRM